MWNLAVPCLGDHSNLCPPRLWVIFEGLGGNKYAFLREQLKKRLPVEREKNNRQIQTY